MMCFIKLMLNGVCYGIIEYNVLEITYKDLKEEIHNIVNDFNDERNGYENWNISDVITELQENYNITFSHISEIDEIDLYK